MGKDFRIEMQEYCSIENMTNSERSLPGCSRPLDRFIAYGIVPWTIGMGAFWFVALLESGTAGFPSGVTAPAVHAIGDYYAFVLVPTSLIIVMRRRAVSRFWFAASILALAMPVLYWLLLWVNGD